MSELLASAGAGYSSRRPTLCTNQNATAAIGTAISAPRSGHRSAARLRSCARPSNSCAVIAPIDARNMSQWVSQTSPYPRCRYLERSMRAHDRPWAHRSPGSFMGSDRNAPQSGSRSRACAPCRRCRGRCSSRRRATRGPPEEAGSSRRASKSPRAGRSEDSPRSTPNRGSQRPSSPHSSAPCPTARCGSRHGSHSNRGRRVLAPRQCRSSSRILAVRALHGRTSSGIPRRSRRWPRSRTVNRSPNRRSTRKSQWHFPGR
jgi:hypothetical protein